MIRKCVTRILEKANTQLGCSYQYLHRCFYSQPYKCNLVRWYIIVFNGSWNYPMAFYVKSISIEYQIEISWLYSFFGQGPNFHSIICTKYKLVVLAILCLIEGHLLVTITNTVYWTNSCSFVQNSFFFTAIYFHLHINHFCCPGIKLKWLESSNFFVSVLIGLSAQ